MHDDVKLTPDIGNATLPTPHTQQSKTLKINNQWRTRIKSVRKSTIIASYGDSNNAKKNHEKDVRKQWC